MCAFSQSKAMNLYEACLTLLQVYSKNNLGRQRIDVTAEEEQYQDLLLIMELLTNLLSKEFIDFSDTGRGPAARADLVVSIKAKEDFPSVKSFDKVPSMYRADAGVICAGKARLGPPLIIIVSLLIRCFLNARHCS